MYRFANFGCGVIQPDGWTNIDREDYGQDHVMDVTDGLKSDDESFDGVVANHSLQEIPYPFLLPTLGELCPDRHVKSAAVECYRSQVNDAVRASVYVRERVWRVAS